MAIHCHLCSAECSRGLYGPFVLMIPICVQFMHKGRQLCLGIYNWLKEFMVNVIKVMIGFVHNVAII